MGSRGSLVGVLPLKAIARWWVPDPECPLRSLCEEVGSGPLCACRKMALAAVQKDGREPGEGLDPRAGGQLETFLPTL